MCFSFNTKALYSIEINKLADMLSEAGIPFEKKELWGGYQIIYPNAKNRICDAVCHSFSYGNTEGLLEIMGLLEEDEGSDENDDVLGGLTAQEVFERIYKHCYNKK